METEENAMSMKRSNLESTKEEEDNDDDDFKQKQKKSNVRCEDETF